MLNARTVKDWLVKDPSRGGKGMRILSLDSAGCSPSAAPRGVEVTALGWCIMTWKELGTEAAIAKHVP